MVLGQRPIEPLRAAAGRSRSPRTTRSALHAGRRQRAPNAPGDWSGGGATQPVASGSTATASETGTPGAAAATASAHGGTEAVEDTGGIPEAVPEVGSGAITARVGNPLAAEDRANLEQIGDYQLVGTRRMVGQVMYRNVVGLYRPGGRTTDIRPILQLFQQMIAQARAAGARELHITGEMIANPNVLRIQRLAARFGGTARRIDATTNEIVFPLTPQ